ncbi:serine C-palmitoyltransferase LCB1 KNAG_0K00250 [Huiozyma naganishii CBS 8797]|uniref:serine C-palmitoyltransferase n=1 Tax=Huiozyma naganishii (strain ATCC MYA-139 / BCRC 22969 / CBS 8797 / KCTC 17520 / NBRC 10181 / NCYC 3082 / Yp74L-3) TaxID=1071383 RepID=J7RRB3_HUIN7|nr:hypothetical protein KNAG_0K00250 [Kazachstania naganishii CBS 8797]CCK72393.1 hypothetical protein KNAG_0K00250 [Kazachstania naganishii CBS 8797]
MSSIVRLPGVLPESIPIPSFIVTACTFFWVHFHDLMVRLPLGNRMLNYIEKSSHDDPYRTIIEVSLILYGIYYYLSNPQKKKSLQGINRNLSKQEIDNLIDEWEPEGLVHRDAKDNAKQEWRLAKIPVVVDGGVDNYVSVTRNDAQERFDNVFNMSSYNFLQLSQTESVLEKARQTIKQYGVGACGPAGFYGNQDVHWNLEYDLAKFFGTEAAVLYGQDFTVAPSVLSAFTKRGDVIVADDQVSLSLQNALQLSRSTVYYFEHNNIESLDKLLTQLNAQEAKEKLPAIPRKFIVTEGIFQNIGDIAPLPELVKLKMKHKYRLFVDETLSLGVLGKTGRGLSEHFGMPRATSIDVTVGSLATAIGTSGGFTLGDAVMSNHQHIGSNAYCFSACLPAYAVSCASKILRIMDEDNSAVSTVQQLSKSMFNFFDGALREMRNYITVVSDDVSPVVHLELTPEFRSSRFHYTADQLFTYVSSSQKKRQTTIIFEPYEAEEQFLQAIVDELLMKHNILITRNIFVLKQETLPLVPSLKICCNANMNEQELLGACASIKEVILGFCSNK